MVFFVVHVFPQHLMVPGCAESNSPKNRRSQKSVYFESCYLGMIPNSNDFGSAFCSFSGDFCRVHDFHPPVSLDSKDPIRGGTKEQGIHLAFGWPQLT